ncbi:MAG: carboxylate--amine ligase [Lachnospiraceae bacterium]|nr:carboxylate--amine ligase [Lachnospiraceae bacterium]MBD5511129.1 carboxylate--amine ligase [Lachnospiraceae bacterium]
MGVHPLKKFIYHHGITAKTYNIIRNYRRNKFNKLSDADFARQYYRKNTGRELNLENPVNFDEKLWYLKLHVRDPLLTICTDKYRVREYVKQCGLEHILNELYGVYDSFEEIPFDKLPKRFIIKCNHTSGMNAIFDRERPFDSVYYKHEFGYWMKRNCFWDSREWNYKDIVPKIICERILEQPGKSCLDDYKFMCFDGKVRLVFGETGICMADGSHNPDSVRNVYDRDYHLLKGVRFTRNNFPEEMLPKPKNYEKMVEYAEILAKPFRHVRVDLYNIDGEIYFGEMTFYHQGCCSKVYPEEMYNEAGSWIDISNL